MMIASFFVFMLLHGSAVCNELYPISVVEDIIQEQPEWSSDNYIEPLQGKSYDGANAAANPSESDPMVTKKTVIEDVSWMKTEIVDRYGFKKDPKLDIWTYQPNFNVKDLKQEALLNFKTTSEKVKQFFKQNSNWDVTKATYRTADSGTELLYITAARYMLVTNILYEQSGGLMMPCVKTQDKKIVIPASGVCYPAPYGSATCTSDYDVGLIGKNAGRLAAKFNEYFQGVNGFGKPSEFVFDTNVYAYSLEFAMPSLFVGLPNTFADDLKKKEGEDDFKMQELASAYYKVFKYNELYFKELKDGALATMKAMKIKKSQHTNLIKWLDIFFKMDTETKMKLGDYDSPEALRKAHNERYQQLLQSMSENGGHNPDIQDILARAEIYAAEAYHTRGAIRHIVGVMQMRVHMELTLNDLWVSMIENWGESNKEYNHCGVIPPKDCFLKMSKYLWRMFTAMNRIRGSLQKKGISVRDVMTFLSGSLDPTWVMMVWNNYKKKMINVTNKKELDPFLTKFNCGQNGLINLADCMANMQKSVMGYNKKLAAWS